MLSFDLDFKELYTLDGLTRIHTVFLNYLKDSDQALHDKLLKAYKVPPPDDLLLEIAPYLEDFISYLFNIHTTVHLNQERHKTFSLVAKVKRLFVQRYALKQHREMPTSRPELNFKNDLAFAKAVNPLLMDFDENALAPYVIYTLWAMRTPEGIKHHKDSVLFKEPIKKTEAAILLDDLKLDSLGKYSSDCGGRKGFSLTDKGHSFQKALDQAHYCIFCHHQKRDSCSKGLKNSDTKQGCPLGQKISEMNQMKSMGYSIGALAIICIDNPLVAATGHRICNDCRQACIFQKQEAVDIPGVESQIFKNVLELPFGFEIYALLTKWNPLNFESPLPSPKTGHTALVVGQGPAGFSLAHYLIRNGIQVLAIDGLKIEPIPTYLKNTAVGVKDIDRYLADLSERLIYGFGGVAEYGITPRWDKNNLLIIRLLLERNSLYALRGGIRFGSQITHTQAFDLGIDHIALCTGAGSPKILDLKHNLAKGVRLASDFLMALQLTGAFKSDSLSALTIDLPIIVIGGGLTAIDAATEALAYYVVQVKRTLKRINDLKENGIFDSFYGALSESEKNQLNRWLDHANTLKDLDDPLPYLQEWGGCSVVYRGTIENSPSCKLNPQELHHAFKEGIYFLDQATPLEFIVDSNNTIQGLKVERFGIESTLPAKSIIMAVGTEPGEITNYKNLYP